MATYKAVMRPALEYASSVWSPIASSTSINKLQVMQNAALRTATRCTQDTNIQITCNNKILRTPPPHTSSSKERLPPHSSHPCPAQNKQISLPQIILTQSRRQNTSISTMPPLQHPHTHDTHHLFNCTHIRTTLSLLDLWTDPVGVTALLARWTEKLAGGPQAGTSDSTH